MKAWKILAEASAPDGGRLQLCQRDDEFVIKVGGQLLMSSRSHGSEEAMAEAGLPPALTRSAARVLVGGLGCGYTVRAVLGRVGPKAQIVVAEIAQAVIEWNRGPLGPLAGHPLDDARVMVERADVKSLLAPPANLRGWDAILLDVDNGPQALTTQSNHGLYQSRGIFALHAALAPGGTLVVWSASPDVAFAARLRAGGFTVEVRQVPARTHAGKAARGGQHTLFVARRPNRPR